MQDRFRYRVWDKSQNKWLHFDFSTYPTYQDRIWQALTDGETFYQCTGLKDKNGKLIYEGDIVRFKDNVTIKGSKTHIAAVEHNEAFNAFMYHAECMGLYTVNKAQNEQFDVEVIGNIYENPELLKECEDE